MKVLKFYRTSTVLKSLLNNSFQGSNNNLVTIRLKTANVSVVLWNFAFPALECLYIHTENTSTHTQHAFEKKCYKTFFFLFGRHTNIPREKQMCNFYNVSKVGDEFHDKFLQLRNAYTKS